MNKKEIINEIQNIIETYKDIINDKKFENEFKDIIINDFFKVKTEIQKKYHLSEKASAIITSYMYYNLLVSTIEYISKTESEIKNLSELTRNKQTEENNNDEIISEIKNKINQITKWVREEVKKNDNNDNNNDDNNKIIYYVFDDDNNRYKN